jgi:predicted RNase H-like nuclease (RuvC/YqgF family)
MQKNIVFGVNAALAGQPAEKPQKVPPSDAVNTQVETLEADIAYLKDENSKFATAVEEMQAQNEELRTKIDELIAAQQASSKGKKKRTTKKK